MKKLNLKELELKLPRIDENYSKILLGGDSYADDAVFGGGCDLIRDKEIGQADIGWDAPLDYDNAYDLDISNDGYQDDGGYQDEGQNGGNSTGTGSGQIPTFTIPTTLLDGMNLNNNSLYIATPQGQFTDQLKFALESNSVIKNILSNVNLGQVALTITTQDLASNINAQTSHVNAPNYQITFNSDYANNGWTSNNGGGAPTTDGFDMSFVYTLGGITEEMRETLFLVKTLLHESFHLRHWNNLMNALVLNGADPNDPANATNEQYGLAMQTLLSQGYSQDFVDMFGSGSLNAAGNYVFTPSWTLPVPFTNTPHTTMYQYLSHQYMIQHEEGVFNEAIWESIDDLLNLQDIKNNMESWIQELQNNAQQYGDESNPDGGTPSGPNWPALLEQQQSQYEDFMDKYGHLFP